jgi:chromosome partitioning protein
VKPQYRIHAIPSFNNTVLTYCRYCVYPAEMKVLAIQSQKGGAGKTTLAINLAVAAEQAALATIVLDLDPQASAMGWRDSRTAETPAVVSIVPARLPASLQAAKQGGPIW